MKISKKARKWDDFADRVHTHIENYVIPQYGDDGDDPAQEYSAEECIQQSKKYLARFGKQSRPGEEERDLLKAAHYIQMAWKRIIK